MSAGWDPEAGLAVVERSVLAGKINTLSIALNVLAAALRQRAGTGGELGRDSSVGGNPVGESVLAVLDDGLGCFISVICGTGLTRGDRGIINELQEVLSVTSNDGELLAVFAKSVKLVGVGSLQLLTGDVGELGFSDKGLGLSTDKLLLENNDLGRVWLLVLELSNLIGDLLLAYLRN